ncbi:unnamed protein product, partial [Effrenium voratum]
EPLLLAQRSLRHHGSGVLGLANSGRRDAAAGGQGPLPGRGGDLRVLWRAARHARLAVKAPGDGEPRRAGLQLPMCPVQPRGTAEGVRSLLPAFDRCHGGRAHRPPAGGAGRPELRAGCSLRCARAAELEFAAGGGAGEGGASVHGAPGGSGGAGERRPAAPLAAGPLRCLQARRAAKDPPSGEA